MKIEDKNTEEYDLFLKYSEEIGLDNSMVQAAGGNTSIKIDDNLWIKASGRWLVNSRSEESMIAVSISKIKNALKKASCNDIDIIHEIPTINVYLLLMVSAKQSPMRDNMLRGTRSFSGDVCGQLPNNISTNAFG